MTVQSALCMLLTAGLFFFVGRTSLEWSNPPSVLDRQGPSLDLNRATKAELRLLPGVGDALAQRIIEYRQQHGAFQSVDDLGQVSGIGPKSLARLRPWLFVALENRVVAEEETLIVPAAQKPLAKNASASASKKPTAKATELINVNQASQDELRKLPGIGPKMSQRILDERAKGPFKSVEDLRRVPGIGPKTLEKLRPYVVIEESRPSPTMSAAIGGD